MTSIQYLSPEEWTAMVRRQVQKQLDISLEEFIQNLKDGSYGDPDDDPKIMSLVMLLPSEVYREVNERED